MNRYRIHEPITRKIFELAKGVQYKHKISHEVITLNYPYSGDVREMDMGFWNYTVWDGEAIGFGSVHINTLKSHYEPL